MEMPGPVHYALKTGCRSAHPIRNSQHTSHIVLKLPVSNEKCQTILKQLIDGGNANSIPGQCRMLLYIYKVPKDDSKPFEKLTL